MSDLPVAEPAGRVGRRGLSVRQGLGLVAMAGVLLSGVVWLAKAVGGAREAARASQCLCNLCAIKMALLNYHEAHGSFPPAYVADAQGRPMHSWRVLILPWLEQRALYARYDFDEPWDGPSNRLLLATMPSVYACPSHPGGAARGLTDYVVVTGPSTVFPGAATVRRDQITDGLDATATVVEASRLRVPWTAPVDLDIRTMSFRVNDSGRPSLSSFHPSGAVVATVDGGYHRLPVTTPESTIRAMLTIDGGERFDWSIRE